MQAFTAVKRGVDKVIEWLCIIILAVMTVLVTYQVVTRYFFSKPSAISETLAQYLFVWMIIFLAFHNYKSGVTSVDKDAGSTM